MRNKKEKLISQYGKDAVLMKDSKNDIYISKGRLPCEQPFQRLLTTYDGKVGMCCYDWGATHTVGYLDELGFKILKKNTLKLKIKQIRKLRGLK